ncbi:MAG: cytochrome c3 family protein, partial [Desulfuromonadales bacterium]|nr:cytochrome c3 family protein [Desulfuromonadales bacterium]
MRNSLGLNRHLLSLLGFAGMLLFGNVLPSYALLPAHQNVDGCSTCHSLHASPGGTLFAVETDPELLCLSCHGPGGSSSLKVVTHNLAGVGATSNGYITCNECHNSHNNGQEGGRVNVDGTYNIKLLGLTYDYNNVGSPLAVASQI